MTFGTDNGHYLRAYKSGVAAADAPVVGEIDEHWTLIPIGGDIYGLESAHRTFLSALDADECRLRGLPEFSVTTTAQYLDKWERWRLVRTEDGRVGWESWLGRYLCAEGGGGREVIANREKLQAWESFTPNPPIGSGGDQPGPGGVVRLIDGWLRQQGRSVADNSGPRRVHGCSDFVAMAKFNEDRDTYLRNLDTTAKWQQFTRLGWRCNGWVFTPRGLDIDPLRHPWWESALRGVIQEHRDRGLKVKLSSFDMFNWTDAQAREWFKRTAQIASEYGDTVAMFHVTNEMHGTAPDGESDRNIALGNELLDICQPILPNALMALSDPNSRDKAGMKRLGRSVALVHQFATMGRYFNDLYENYPGIPVDDDEPRGPNGPHGGDVTNSIEDPNQIFALYTMGIAVGKICTYFNSPGAAERKPLDSTWGFKELPQLWRDLEIPEDIGQGSLCAGHKGGFMQVKDSHAGRADGIVRGNYGLGGISEEWDGQPWAVRADYDATWSVWYADGKAWEGRLSKGQVIPTPRGFTWAVVRAIS